MEILFLVGRVFYGGYFVYSGINHFRFRKMMVPYIQSKNVPMAEFLNAVAGLLILLGGAGILLGVYIEWSVLAIALFLIPVTVVMHDFWNAQDPTARMSLHQHFLKNMVMLGAALMLLAIPAPWPFALVQLI